AVATQRFRHGAVRRLPRPPAREGRMGNGRCGREGVPQAGRDEVIGSLRDLAHALSVETVTVDQLVTRLGGRAIDLAGSVVVEDPTLDGVARASIVRQVHG